MISKHKKQQYIKSNSYLELRKKKKTQKKDNFRSRRKLSTKSKDQKDKKTTFYHTQIFAVLIRLKITRDHVASLTSQFVEATN